MYTDTQGGVGFYRSTQPHKYLKENYSDEFEVDFTTGTDFSNIDPFLKYDIVHIHKGLYPNMAQFYTFLEKLRENNVTTVMDIDDSWDLSPTHPLYTTQKMNHIDEIVKGNLSKFDYVTTTTPIFASEIEPFNKSVFVLPNAIDPNDEHFITKKEESTDGKIRFGFVMGSAHEQDVAQMGNLIAGLSQETLDKIQIVLCGFDTRGVVNQIDSKTKKVTQRPIQPMETTWYRYENMVTNNRKMLSKRYRKFLNMFVPNLEYPFLSEEKYRRCWTKDMNHYYQHYNTIDVLYAPLEPKHFNYVKSQLKAIECCFSNTALIAQNYGPYTIDLKHALDENGNYNGGNALLVDIDKNGTDWVKFTERLANDADLLASLKKNIHETLKDKYSLENVTKTRAEFYKSIVKKEDVKQ